MTHTNTSCADESFSYDANGNRNSAGDVTSDGNRLAGDGTFTYTYDDEGNLTSRTLIATGDQTLYQWDDRNRLTEVDQFVGGVRSVEQYTYDARNRRIGVVEGGATTWTVSDGMTPLLDFNGAGQVTARYLNGPTPAGVDAVLARQTSAGVAWYLADRLGTIRDLVDNSGVVIDHVDYGAFSNPTGETNPAVGDRMKFAGMELDAAADEYYDRARYYDAAMGRFIDEDPIGFASGTTDPYQYAGNNPLNSLDPTGLAAELLRPGDPGAPTIGQILRNPTVQQQLSWFWKRVGANGGREEGG